VNDLENRVSKLEKHTYPEDKVTLVIVYPDGRNPSEAALEAAKAEYKVKHPDWQERDFNVIWVIDEATKEATEQLLAGEGT